VERGGDVRAYHVPTVNGVNLAAIVDKQVARGSLIYSDENHTTRHAASAFRNARVNHKDGEYVRGPVYTNHRGLLRDPETRRCRNLSLGFGSPFAAVLERI
jgi:hypothetical protein